ncbi:MAG: hypothetical protein ACREX3_15290, partial [Gammaproteobacteria bacterium]
MPDSSTCLLRLACSDFLYLIKGGPAGRLRPSCRAACGLAAGPLGRAATGGVPELQAASGGGLRLRDGLERTCDAVDRKRGSGMGPSIPPTDGPVEDLSDENLGRQDRSSVGRCVL